MDQEIIGQYNLVLVALSYIVASLAAFTALFMSDISRVENNNSLIWSIGSGLILGLGIWSMHFIGMLAFQMHINVTYDITITIVSLLFAIASSYFALYVAKAKTYTLDKLLLSALLLGGGIGAMHYTGMAAMQSIADMHYEPKIVLLTMAVAFDGSLAAQWWFQFSHKHTKLQSNTSRFLSALIIGLAIAGMHYTGMYATSMTIPVENLNQFNASIDNDFFAAIIFVSSTFIMLTLIFMTRHANSESGKARITMLLHTMSVVAVTVVSFSSSVLYYTAYEEKKHSLENILEIETRSIEGFAKFYHKNNLVRYDEKGRNSTLSQLAETKNYKNSIHGDIEFLLFEQKGNEIIFLINDDHEHKSIDTKSLYADSPLLLAGQNLNGNIVSEHFENDVEMLTAFRHIGMLGISAIAQIPVSKIRSPFINATTIALVGALISILLSSGFILATINPIIERLRDENSERKQAEKSLHLLTEHLEDSVKERTEQLQTAVVEAWRANKAKSEFLANMSHEIRTPMNGVLGMIHLLQKTELSQQQKEYASTVANSAESLLVVINDVLDFSKIESGKLELEEAEFNLRTTIEDVASLLAEAAHVKGLELAVNIASNVPKWIKGDSGRIRQILTNLTGNAIKFTDKGEVVIRITLEKILDNSNLLRFEISDTGIGISKTAQAKIFNSFEQADSSTTRQYGGTGLGLSISRQLVALMEGEMKVRSDIGVGSTFFFTISVAKSEKITNDIVQNQKFDSLRALVIDDNETNRVIYKHQLTEWGIDFDTADDGANGLEKVFSAVEKGQAFDLILLDMMMPNMDGLDVYRRIKETLGKNTPCVFMLTSVMQGDVAKQGKELGIDIVLTKPVKQTLLYNSIAGHFSNKPKSTLITANKALGADANFSNKNLKILLVEDHLINQKVILGILKGLGINADLAQNGQEAVAAVTDINYNIVFMDVQMPVLDGFGSTKEIRRIEGDKKHTLIIAMTANAMSGDKEKCLAAGMDDYLSKPINPKELVDIINQWCGSEIDKPKNLSA